MGESAHDCVAGLPLPIEVLELLHQPSGKRLFILLLNALAVTILLKHQFDRGQGTDGQLEESTS